MNRLIPILLCSLLALGYPAITSATEDAYVCSDIGGAMFDGKTDCKKGDIIIMTNTLMAAYLCDFTLPTITGDNVIICHFLGKKRPERRIRK